MPTVEGDDSFHLEGMTVWQSDRLTDWQTDSLADWQIGSLAVWQIDRLEVWQFSVNGGMRDPLRPYTTAGSKVVCMCWRNLPIILCGGVYDWTSCFMPCVSRNPSKPRTTLQMTSTAVDGVHSLITTYVAFQGEDHDSDGSIILKAFLTDNIWVTLTLRKVDDTIPKIQLAHYFYSIPWWNEMGTVSVFIQAYDDAPNLFIVILTMWFANGGGTSIR